LASVTLDDVSVSRDDRRILSLIDLEVAHGELVSLIGPSGSGKTTLLRVVAGLEPVASGDVRIDGRDVTDLGPADRRVAMVFQDNTLMPHVTARRNIAFPLVVEGRTADEIRARVDAEARVLAITHLLERRPGELSHGHQQIVQVAKAMVRVPDVFLLDEPLARIDTHLRVVVRTELALLQRGYGVTTIWATNDPVEAMALSDRIVVLEDGFIRAIGSPQDLYDTPPNLAVAVALGLPPMTIVDADVAGVGGLRSVVFGSVELASRLALGAGPVKAGIRPEDVAPGPGGFATQVTACQFHGDHQIVTLDAAGIELLMRDDDMSLSPGDLVSVRLRLVHFFAPDTGAALGHEAFR